METQKTPRITKITLGITKQTNWKDHLLEVRSYLHSKFQVVLGNYPTMGNTAKWTFPSLKFEVTQTPSCSAAPTQLMPECHKDATMKLFLGDRVPFISWLAETYCRTVSIALQNICLYLLYCFLGFPATLPNFLIRQIHV